MLSNFASQIAQYIGNAYRQLVRQCADDKPPEVEDAIAVLVVANRSPSQLDRDVERLVLRRQDATQLASVRDLEKDMEEASKRYRSAIEKETTAKRELDAATRPGVPTDSLDIKKKVNKCRFAVSNATAEAEDAFAKLSSLRVRADRLRAESSERLRSTAADAGEWDDPENFALV